MSRVISQLSNRVLLIYYVALSFASSKHLPLGL